MGELHYPSWEMKILNNGYRIQRYEGASTIYGPSTLDAYIDIYSNLVQYLGESSVTPSAGIPPPDLTQSPLTLRVSQASLFHACF